MNYSSETIAILPLKHIDRNNIKNPNSNMTAQITISITPAAAKAKKALKAHINFSNECEKLIWKLAKKYGIV